MAEDSGVWVKFQTQYKEKSKLWKYSRDIEAPDVHGLARDVFQLEIPMIYDSKLVMAIEL